jgi:hypothetical protein
VIDEGVDIAVQVLGRLLVREGQYLLDELVDGAVVVRVSRVDPQEEALQEGTLARSDLDLPADGKEPGAEVGVHRRPGALQDQAADQVGVAQRQLLGDDASPGEPGHVGGRDVERPQDPGRVIGHLLHRNRPGRHGGAACPRLSNAVKR